MAGSDTHFSAVGGFAGAGLPRDSSLSGSSSGYSPDFVIVVFPGDSSDADHPHGVYSVSGCSTSGASVSSGCTSSSGLSPGYYSTSTSGLSATSGVSGGSFSTGSSSDVQTITGTSGLPSTRPPAVPGSTTSSVTSRAPSSQMPTTPTTTQTRPISGPSLAVTTVHTPGSAVRSTTGSLSLSVIVGVFMIASLLLH